MAYVYKIINDINDKVYIGLTFYSIQQRWQIHIRDKNKPQCKERPLYRAMNKYGIEHFHIEEIEECDDNIVNEREVYWIKFYNSYHNGYNATYGGEGRREYDGEEFYQLYQQGLTCVEIAQIKNCDPGIVGKYLRSKGINTFTLQTQRAKQLYGKKCRGIKNENVIEFNSMMDAARYIVEHKLSTDKIEGVQTHISQVCNGKRKTAYGYKWELI